MSSTIMIRKWQYKINISSILTASDPTYELHYHDQKVAILKKRFINFSASDGFWNFFWKRYFSLIKLCLLSALYAQLQLLCILTSSVFGFACHSAKLVSTKSWVRCSIFGGWITSILIQPKSIVVCSSVSLSWVLGSMCMLLLMWFEIDEYNVILLHIVLLSQERHSFYTFPRFICWCQTFLTLPCLYCLLCAWVMIYCILSCLQLQHRYLHSQCWRLKRLREGLLYARRVHLPVFTLMNEWLYLHQIMLLQLTIIVLLHWQILTFGFFVEILSDDIYCMASLQKLLLVLSNFLSIDHSKNLQ